MRLTQGKPATWLWPPEKVASTEAFLTAIEATASRSLVESWLRVLRVLAVKSFVD